MFADRKAPRFNARKFRQRVITKELYEKWKEKSNYKLDFTTFKRIWKQIAQQMQIMALEDTNGIMLPEALGNIYIGWVKSKKRPIDYKTSREVDQYTYYDNWHTDGKLAKIIYLACGKYKIRGCRMWGFLPITPFKELVTRTVQENSDMYKHSKAKKYYKYDANRRSANISARQPDEVSPSGQQDNQ